MRIELLNYIRCPLCKKPLELTIFEINEKNLSEDFPQDGKKKLVGIKGSYEEIIKIAKKLGFLEETIKETDVKFGILYCKSCKRWFPIGNYIPTVPELYCPDNLRNKSKEFKFIEKWKNLFPEDILTHGLPWNISNATARKSALLNK